jgi:RNA processing factor Prp31
MTHIDVELYISQIISFFKTNPAELTKLIGDLDEETFFSKVKETAYKNFQETGDMVLTKNQMIEIVVEMHHNANNKPKNDFLEKIFEDSKYGKICLN